MIFMSKIRFIVLMIVVLVVTFAHPMPSNGQATPNPTPITIRGFHLISPTEGWVWTDHIYWTKDSGQTWKDITPPTQGDETLAEVGFADNQHGTAVATKFDPANSHEIYNIAQTTDGGKTWETKPLSIFPVDALTFYPPGNISVQFLDSHTGWLRVRKQSSSNFDVGLLFKTTDGGATWTELNLPHDSYFKTPIGDPVYFVTEQLGWIAGSTGQASNLLYRTQDGGQTWQTETVGVVPSGASARVYELPQFANAQDGVLTIGNTVNNKGFEEVYITHDGGMTWQLDSTLDGFGPVRLLDSTRWIGVITNQKIVSRTTTQGATPSTLSQDPIVTNIVDMDFVSASAAFALSNYQTCPPNPTPGQCIEHRQLLYTNDGGQTWQILTLPEATSAPRISSTAIATLPVTH